MCYGCKHFNPNQTCAAFATGIPQPILWSEADHRKPYKGDGGTRFDPIDKQAADYADDLFRTPA